MTDQERARDLMSRVVDMTVDELAEELAAVRLEERAAIVAYCRRRYVATALANAIERGEYLQ